MSQQVHGKIEEFIKDNQVVLFMKGTKEAPQCGFSSQVVQILNSHEVAFLDINVLADWDLREGVKSYSNWPTIPQLYVDNKFVGGCDIIMDLERKGELKGMFSQ
jgi:monothiol glutaredoxin